MNLSALPETGIPSTGISVALALGATVLSERAFLSGVAKLSANFGIDYAARETTPDVLKIAALHEALLAESWTDAEFRHRMTQFLSEQKFPNWTVADFMRADRPKVYPYSWYVAQVTAAASNADAIGTYRLPRADKPVWGWKHECDAVLAPWGDGRRPAVETPTLPPREELTEETRSMISDVLKVQRLELRIEDLEREVRLHQQENDKLRRQCQMLELALEEAGERLPDDNTNTPSSQAA